MLAEEQRKIHNYYIHEIKIDARGKKKVPACVLEKELLKRRSGAFRHKNAPGCVITSHLFQSMHNNTEGVVQLFHLKESIVLSNENF
jgi:hypothetical protein